ncbi:hypothetical protein F5Y10DRAFT_248845 [Nemania abortiva]|nr:hypothetical protein F5Y10DRAFT_248845 [Nemania abortiva]
MFQWYSNATICYAYLSDVVLPTNATDDDIKSSLANSHWVTRGWTLQELIAPPDVVFYSRDWEAFGTRSELLAALAEITLIDESYLNGRPLEDASIAQRMSWASKRTTSREEDMAYCLLGIFDVNMSLIYGERSKAFRRLQEAISRENPVDHSIYAWGEIVRSPSWVISDDDQIWGSKPMEYNPALADRELFGLLAESPADFMHSGQIVRARMANNYFDSSEGLRSPPFSVGQATKVEFPVLPQKGFAAFHLKCPPIVQIRTIIYALLLCGSWSGPDKKLFDFVLIPQVVVGAHVSRTNEIVVVSGDPDAWVSLADETGNHIYKVPKPYFPFKGGLLFRRVVCNMTRKYDRVCRDVVDGVSLNWLNPPWIEERMRMLNLISFEAGHKQDFAVFIQQTLVDYDAPCGSGKRGGVLKFGLMSIKTLYLAPLRRKRVTSKPVTPVQEGSDALANGPKGIQPFSDIDTALEYLWDHPEDVPYQHEMALPRDEWRVNVGEYVDVYVAVERVYLEDDDSDDCMTEREPDSYVDVIDLVIRVKGDPGYRDVQGSEVPEDASDL